MNSRNRHRYIRLFAGFVLWMAACFCPGTVSAAGNGTCEADSLALHGADQTPAGTVKATPGSTAKATQGNAAGSAAEDTPGSAAEDTPGSAAGSATKVVGDSRFSIAGFDADDTVKEDPTQKRPLTHRIGAEFRPEHIFTINPFLQGENLAQLPVNLSLAAHLKYAFGFHPGSRADRVYGGVYQGIGAAYYDFANPRELGNPVAVYLFQGARIARLTNRLSLDYEWNFGLSFGWKPYDREQNSHNVMMGSKVNALLNVNFFLRWMLTRELDLTIGPTLTHFSNGNTRLPNAGLNSAGLQAGLTYNFGRERAEIPERSAAPSFRRHMSYDVVLFGSWCSKGVEVGGDYYASPDTYPVVGLNVSALYNFGYKFRAGVSLDGVYDGSANIYVPDYIIGTEMEFVRPSIDRQLAVGLSARAEFVMPYFTIGLGLGANIFHKGGDLKSFYQILALKVGITRSSFLHIGYSLRDFHMPNFLMLGVGYRFNNKYPRHY